MFKIITAWNLLHPKEELEEEIESIELRGYNTETFLTGEFSAGIANNEIKSLSVSNIADRLCSTRRNLYFEKGKNRPAEIQGEMTWGRIAGRVVQNFVFNAFNKLSDAIDIDKYSTIREKLNEFSNEFENENSSDFDKLDELGSRKQEKPQWFLNLLNYTGREELSSRLMQEKLYEEEFSEMALEDLLIENSDSTVINPVPWEIGISENVKPDFLIERHNVVGDVKSGIRGVEDRYFLSCIGYALAYENDNKEDINFGVVYYLPTRHSRYAKPITYPQVFIFSITDEARRYFLDVRDNAYSIISKDSAPDLPEESADKEDCPHCKFYNYCKGEGLSL